MKDKNKLISKDVNYFLNYTTELKSLTKDFKEIEEHPIYIEVPKTENLISKYF